MTLLPHTATARILPEHRDNPIHTDDGARSLGYPGAVVAGVTVYAHLCHVALDAWGLEWVVGGGAEVRFLSPVFADEEIALDPVERDGVHLVHATVDSDVRATCEVWCGTRRGATPVFGSAGVALPTIEVPLIDEWERYDRRVGDDIDIFAAEAVVHPAVWLGLANLTTSLHLVDGPWIHARSHVSHHGAAAVGAIATVRATEVRRYRSRSGERAVIEVRIDADGERVAVVEHEAIVRLAPRR